MVWIVGAEAEVAAEAAEAETTAAAGREARIGTPRTREGWRVARRRCLPAIIAAAARALPPLLLLLLLPLRLSDSAAATVLLERETVSIVAWFKGLWRLLRMGGVEM